jgi:hypothetical protein
VQATFDGGRPALRDYIVGQIEFSDKFRHVMLALKEASGVIPAIKQEQDSLIERAVSAIVDGLARADRFEKPTRPVRARLAFNLLLTTGELILNRAPGIGRETAIDLTTDAWLTLIGAGADARH